MSGHDDGECECPLASKHCKIATVRRDLWFQAVRHQDRAAMLRMAHTAGRGMVTREIFAVGMGTGDEMESKTALHLAARENLRDSVAYLLEMLEEHAFMQSVLDLQEPGTKTTPLIEACKVGNLEIVQSLCSAGAKWYLPDAGGVQPRQHAERNGNLEVVAFFNSQHKEHEAGEFKFEDQEEQDVESAAAAEGAEAGAATEGNEMSAEQDGSPTDVAVQEEEGEGAQESASQAPSRVPSHERTATAEAGSGEQGQAETGSGPVQDVEQEELFTPPEFLSPRQTEEVMRVLCNVSFFPTLDAPSLKELSRLCIQITLASGETLSRDENDSQSMFIVVRGKIIAEVRQLESIPPHPDRKWSIRHRLKKRSYRRRLTENDCFGESILLIGDKLYFNMVAEEDAVMLELSKRAFNHFIQQHTRVVPELGSFLALQLVEASEDVDEDMASDLTTEMEQRISEFYKLPDEVEEVEEQKRSLVRAIVEVPLSEHNAKNGLNLANKVFATHGNDWLKTPTKSSLGGGKDTMSLSSPSQTDPSSLSDGDGTGSLAYLRACEELSIRPRNVVLLSLRSADLRLDNISMTTKEGRAIGAALIENKYVTALNLSGNRLFNEAFVKTDKNSVGVFKRHADKYIWNGKGIFEALCLPDAKHSDINLRQTQLGKCTSYGNKELRKMATDLLYQMVENKSADTLTTLKLGSNFLGCPGAIALSEALDRNFNSCKLTYLDISNNGIGDAGANALGSMLASNKSIVELDVGWNHIFEAGTVDFFEGMTDNEGMTALHYGWNRVGERGGIALGRLFFNNKTLQQIDLENCGIVTAACTEIAQGIRENAVLKCVKMQWNPLGIGGVEVLDALTSSPARPLFSLENCSINNMDGHRSRVDLRNITQSYRFNLSVSDDRLHLQPLLELALKECGQNWRNERLNGKAFHFPEEGIWTVPDAGILEFDFVNFEPQTEDFLEMDTDNYRSLLKQIGRIMSSEGRVEIIKQACFSYMFTSEQVIAVLKELPRGIEKEEALVFFFQRILHRAKHMPMILLRCIRRPDVLNLQLRLGPSSVIPQKSVMKGLFDEYRPAGPYELDISKAEDRSVLKKLKKMKADGHFNGCDCNFVFKNGLLRGFKGEILESDCDVDAIDLEALAGECRAWAQEDSSSGKDAIVAVANDVSQDEAESAGAGEAKLPPPRRLKLSFDFEMLDMKKTDMNAVFKGIMKKTSVAAPASGKLPPIESDLQSVAEMGQEHTTETKVITKKKVMLKKIKKKSDVNTEEQEDLDQKSIFPIPRMGQDVLEIEEIKDFTEFTQQRRSTANSKAHTMIDVTSVRTKHTHQGVKLRGGAKKWRPWATFTRSHKQDYEVHAIRISQSKHDAGRIHTVVQGSLGEASCLNYSLDLSMQIIQHTIPRVICFCVSPCSRARADSKNGHADSANGDVELYMYANLKGYPCARDFIWEGQQMNNGDRVITIRPNDANYIAGTYHLTIITERQPCDFDLHVQVTPFQQILRELDTDNDGQPLPGKTRHVDSRVKFVKQLRAKTADLERVFFDITHKSSKRVLKGANGHPIPPKPSMRFRSATGQDAAPNDDEEQDLRPESPMSPSQRAMSVPATMGGRKTPLRDERSGARTSTTTFLTE